MACTAVLRPALTNLPRAWERNKHLRSFTTDVPGIFGRKRFGRGRGRYAAWLCSLPGAGRLSCLAAVLVFIALVYRRGSKGREGMDGARGPIEGRPFSVGTGRSKAKWRAAFVCWLQWLAVSEVAAGREMKRCDPIALRVCVFG